MSENLYKEKYIKYKNKYNQLKIQFLDANSSKSFISNIEMIGGSQEQQGSIQLLLSETPNLKMTGGDFSNELRRLVERDQDQERDQEREQEQEQDQEQEMTGGGENTEILSLSDTPIINQIGGQDSTFDQDRIQESDEIHTQTEEQQNTLVNNQNEFQKGGMDETRSISEDNRVSDDMANEYSDIRNTLDIEKMFNQLGGVDREESDVNNSSDQSDFDNSLSTDQYEVKSL